MTQNEIIEMARKALAILRKAQEKNS